jgi:hypothetical protein
MVRTRSFVVGAVGLCVIVGCSKKEEGRAHGVASSNAIASAAPTSVAAPPSVAASTSAPALEIANAPAAAAATPASDAPASFANGAKESIDNAVGQGCEARSLQGWLEFVCRKRNGTGGHPVRATWPSETSSEDAGANEEVLADEHGELKLKLPYSGDAARVVTIEWSDTRYVLRIQGASAKLEWTSGGLELRRACAHVQDASKARIAEALKAASPGALSAVEASKLPRFGICQQAGFGSYALGLKTISAEGEGTARKLKALLEVIFVAENGSQRRADFGTFEFAPGGLSVSPLRVYDYDDDGKDELIVPYELTPLAGAEAAAPPAIWSLTDTTMTPYANAPSIGPGGFAIEQLDFDMRPDLGDYGPYVAALGPDCGAKTCPPRVTGPRFFFHSLPDGKFSRDDAAAKAALKRACSKKPESLVSESGGSVNVAQTGKNIACALAWGAPPSAVSAELGQKRAALCGASESCPLFIEFGKWANAAPPSVITP